MIGKEFEIPDLVILDVESGYSINVPLVYQDYPFWWEDQPETVARIKEKRATLGIEIEDFPEGLPIRNTDREVSMEEILAEKKRKKAEGK